MKRAFGLYCRIFLTAREDERYQTDASPTATCSLWALRKRSSYSTSVATPRLSSVLKKCGSFWGAIKIFGWSPSQRANEVVPHFGAPRIKKFGFTGGPDARLAVGLSWRKLPQLLCQDTAFSSGAISVARVLLPAPGSPIMRIFRCITALDSPNHDSRG